MNDSPWNSDPTEIPKDAVVPKCIIVFGNPFDGMTTYGPFDDLDEANRWAEINDKEGAGWLNVNLHDPKENEE